MESEIMEKKVLSGKINECWTEFGTADRINGIGCEETGIKSLLRKHLLQCLFSCSCWTIHNEEM